MRGELVGLGYLIELPVLCPTILASIFTESREAHSEGSSTGM